MAGSVGKGARAVGTITRGTTNANRLRRVDRWIASRPELVRAGDPLVVDLGYGASGVTTFELYERLHEVRSDVEVLGLEIDPERVRIATEQLRAGRAGFGRMGTLDRTGAEGRTGTVGRTGTEVRTGRAPSGRPMGRPGDPHAEQDAAPPDPAVSFARGGFEIPVPDARRPVLIRAMNVLRQYEESEVVPAWHMLAHRLQEDGLAIDGTCDEIGRVCSWVALGPAGPRTFTISLRLTGLESPSILAERLVKILIHRNVEGERVHRLIADLDAAWRMSSPLATFSPTQRWIASVRNIKDAGWPVLDGPARWRLGEVTLPWDSVAPDGFAWSAPAPRRGRGGNGA